MSRPQLPRPVPFRHGIVLAAPLALLATPLVSAQSTTAPSRAAAYLDQLRQHANQRLDERDQRRAREQGLGDDNRREPGMPVRSSAAESVRDEFLAEAYGDLPTLEPDRTPSGNTIYDDVYNRRLSARYNASPRARFTDSTSDRYGRDTPTPAHSLPDRTSYFPSVTRPEDRNFGLGPVDVRFGASTFAEYNDNIRRSGTRKIEDVVVGTLFDIGASWQLTEGNRLDVNVGLGIERYLQNHDQIGTTNDDFNLIVSPDSSLSFDLFLGDLLINLHDRFSMRDRGADDFTLDDQELFSQWNNEVGVSLYYPVNAEVDLSFGYDYATTRSLEDRTEYLDRNSHNLFASTSYSPGQTWRAGIQASTSFSEYVLPIQDDVDSYNVGLFFETPLSEYTDFRIDGGYQLMDFSATGAGTSRDDHGDFYGSLSINNQLNTYYRHAVALGHESNLGALSNYEVVDYVRYSFSLDTKRDQSITGAVYYEREEESGGTFQEDVDRWGTSLGYNFLLTPDLGVRVSGNYGEVESELAGRDYERWGASIDLSYTLSEELDLGLRYSYYDTASNTGTQSYNQNRVILNLNYQF